jgi:hypothetical protein
MSIGILGNRAKNVNLFFYPPLTFCQVALVKKIGNPFIVVFDAVPKERLRKKVLVFNKGYIPLADGRTASLPLCNLSES